MTTKKNVAKTGNGTKSGSTAKSGDIAKTEKAGALTNPGAPARGFEDGYDNEDLIIPRAKLLQGLSPEVVNDGLRVGTVINSLTKETLPETFIPIFVFKNYIRFNPKDKSNNGYNPDFEPGAIIWRSNDARDERVITETKFGENGEKPLATSFLNFFSYFPGVPMPIIVSFSKTSYKTGKNLLSLAKFTRGDMFSRVYRLDTEKKINDSNTYFILKVAPSGMATKEDYAVAESWWNDYSMKKSDIKVHDEEAGDEEERGY